MAESLAHVSSLSLLEGGSPPPAFLGPRLSQALAGHIPFTNFGNSKIVQLPVSTLSELGLRQSVKRLLPKDVVSFLKVRLSMNWSLPGVGKHPRIGRGQGEAAVPVHTLWKGLLIHCPDFTVLGPYLVQ